MARMDTGNRSSMLNVREPPQCGEDGAILPHSCRHAPVSKTWHGTLMDVCHVCHCRP